MLYFYTCMSAGCSWSSSNSYSREPMRHFFAAMFRPIVTDGHRCRDNNFLEVRKITKHDIRVLLFI